MAGSSEGTGELKPGKPDDEKLAGCACLEGRILLGSEMDRGPGGPPVRPGAPRARHGEIRPAALGAMARASVEPQEETSVCRSVNTPSIFADTPGSCELAIQWKCAGWIRMGSL